MKFNEVAQTFATIETESSRNIITTLLADLLQKATPEEADIICNLSLGQLKPPYEGTQFNIAEKNMVPIIAQVIGQTAHEVKLQAKQLGDIGAVINEYAWETDNVLTVTQVYKALCHFEEIAGVGSVDKKSNALIALLRVLTPESAKFVIRIILGKLRLGFSDMTVIDALSFMQAGDKSLKSIIESAYNTCADIGLIAYTLKADGIEALKKMEPRVGIPIRPAAAERLAHAQAIIDKIGTCIAQPKLDGFRLQIHIDNTGDKPEIHFFSRNLIDMSSMFPDLLKELKALKVKTLIAEGEAIAFDPNTGHFLPFQETVKRKRKHEIAQAAIDFPLKLYFFDLLYLNGKDLMNLTHEERREQMQKIMDPITSDTIHLIDEKRITTADQLIAYFYEMINKGLEGLVVKRPDSIYMPGKRNFNWIKLKSHEEGQLEDTIDAVVLGYYAGKGKRVALGIGAFLVGVFNKNKDLFETIAKVGTGLTDEEWIDLRKRCDKIAVKEQPHNVVCEKELMPDVWVNPEIVVAIKADEITLSPLHAAGRTQEKLGFALRFPRFIGYRPDKSATEATTINEVARLYEDQYVGKKK